MMHVLVSYSTGVL